MLRCLLSQPAPKCQVDPLPPGPGSRPAGRPKKIVMLRQSRRQLRYGARVGVMRKTAGREISNGDGDHNNKVLPRAAKVATAIEA